MKVSIAYYLLLLYATVMFKPLIPVVKDTLSHTFSEAIHIATVHAMYGSNHLQKELNEAPDNATGKHQTQGMNEESSVPVHVSADNFTSYKYDFKNNNDYTSGKSYGPESGFIMKFSPPPKFC